MMIIIWGMKTKKGSGHGEVIATMSRGHEHTDMAQHVRPMQQILKNIQSIADPDLWTRSLAIMSDILTTLLG